MNQIKNSNLIASIAVFMEICDTAKDIQSILTEFIKSTFAFDKKQSLNSLEVTYLLKKHFDFDLPEAVVKTCLNSLKTKKFLDKKTGSYYVIDKSYNFNTFLQIFQQKKTSKDAIESELVKYYENYYKIKIDESGKDELINNLILYLLDNNLPEKFSIVINKFFIEKSKDNQFILELNQIKEGLVLITGLRFTDNLNNLGKWDDELTIYLDLEHLFNFAGYNGEVFQRLFSDFYNLVNEINQSSIRKRNKKLIHLVFFEDVKNDYENYFWVAEKIIKREQNYSPDKVAMKEICNGCTTVSDVLRKKTDFETQLKIKDIRMKKDIDYSKYPIYNIEDPHLIDKYKEKYEEEDLKNILHSFTKINYFRKGNNRVSFERCGHIVLTGKTAALYLSKDLEIKNNAKDIPFATDIYFITNRIWFKLNKGFSKSEKLPSTLDIITKAQIALSSQINGSIEKKYKKLKIDIEDGSINHEQAQEYYYNLREKAKKPEDITLHNVEEAVKFIFDDDYEKYIREKSEIAKRVEDGEKAIIKLRIIENKEKFECLKKKRNPIKIKIKLIYFSLKTLFLLIVISFPIGVYYLIKYLKTDQDTPIGIFGSMITILIELIALWKYVSSLHKWFKKYCKKIYYKNIRII